MAEENTLFDDESSEEVTQDQEEPLNLEHRERRLVTQPYDLSLSTLVDDIKKERLLLNIEYQRQYVWDRAKASRLIESLLLNIPVPVCYFAENEDGAYEVIDGLQRITTISDYLEGKFELKGIPVLSELEGKFFSDLTLRDQRRLSGRTIRCIVITEDSDPDIKFDVFERLNTGSARLGAQELRNCIYRGELNDFLRRTAEVPYFTGILSGIRNRRMEFEELVLRFFSLYKSIADYRPPLRQLLNGYMRNNRIAIPGRADMDVFADVCRTVAEVFGDSAFRLPAPNGRPAPGMNKALFDAIMIPFAHADREAIRAAPEAVREVRHQLLQDEAFLFAIGRATADRSRMHYRVSKFSEGLAARGISITLHETLKSEQ
ncbi:hypothetical protein FHU36_003306 [Nonomuraea muscovyensis]|uniref:GmrSD restriction endonucleases N-terminal domain-containing protein n=1 Tax=Nonomuraea muscovyensis TaxID=1124761 RepID=A0A7X0C1I6_9ACTN|nr:DUF262 domain-containing protein [Nonomuraea muscovyensis]MBB6346797.1 hypothetical protein [Nonomuraea muscovyensis]